MSAQRIGDEKTILQPVPRPRLDGRREPHPRSTFNDGKRFWTAAVFVVGVLAAGFGFRDQVGRFFVGVSPSELVERLNRADANYAHLHEEVRDSRKENYETRADLRAWRAGKALPDITPIPDETP